MTTKTATKTVKVPARTSLLTLCTALGVKPKIARIALRKSSFVKFEDAWSFTDKELPAVKKLLSGSTPAPAAKPKPAAKVTAVKRTPAVKAKGDNGVDSDGSRAAA